MRTATITILAAAFCLMVSTGPADARMGSGGWGMDNQYSRMYDAAKVETFSGVVTSVDTIKPMRGMSRGVHLTVKTDREDISVHLGPEWFIENQDAGIGKGDRVEVTGSRITFEGRPAVIASEVEKDGQVLRLRDDDGFPLWAGWRRR